MKLTSVLMWQWVGCLQKTRSVPVSSESFPLQVRAKMKSKEIPQWLYTWRPTHCSSPRNFSEKAMPTGWALTPQRRLPVLFPKALADSPALLNLESPMVKLSSNDSLNVFMGAKKKKKKKFEWEHGGEEFWPEDMLLTQNNFWKVMPFSSLVKGIKMSKRMEFKEGKVF